MLLTGATGFVGSQILRALKEKGVFVRAITRQKYTDGIADQYVSTPDLFLESVEWWAEQLVDIDTVIHAAWYVEPSKYLYAQENQICLDGSLQLAEAFKYSDASHFTGIGTCFEYDLDEGVLSVDTSLKPTTPYSIAKVDLFYKLSQILSETQKSFGWCRLFYLYGENEHPSRLVPYLHQQLQSGEKVELTSGNQIRDFMDVTDAGNAIAKSALDQVCGAINICSGIPVTVRGLAEQIADQYGRRDLLIFGSREDNAVDPPKIVGIP